MATHCRILAWRIPGTEEPGGLQSMGFKELDITANFTFTFTFAGTSSLKFLNTPIQQVSLPHPPANEETTDEVQRGEWLAQGQIAISSGHRARLCS